MPFLDNTRHPDALLPSFSPGRQFPRPTPGRVLVVDHQSIPGFAGTSFATPPLRPIGT